MISTVGPNVRHTFKILSVYLHTCAPVSRPSKHAGAGCATVGREIFQFEQVSVIIVHGGDGNGCSDGGNHVAQATLNDTGLDGRQASVRRAVVSSMCSSSIIEVAGLHKSKPRRVMTFRCLGMTDFGTTGFAQKVLLNRLDWAPRILPVFDDARKLGLDRFPAGRLYSRYYSGLVRFLPLALGPFKNPNRRGRINEAYRPQPAPRGMFPMTNPRETERNFHRITLMMGLFF